MKKKIAITAFHCSEIGIHLVIVTSRSTCFTLSLLTFDMAIENETKSPIKIRNNYNSTQRIERKRREEEKTIQAWYWSHFRCAKHTHTHTLNFIVLSSHQENERTLFQQEYLPSGQIGLAVFCNRDWLFFFFFSWFYSKSKVFFLILSIGFSKKHSENVTPFSRKKKLEKKLNTMFIL